MSIEQYQRSVNTLDKDIASLEKKKAEVDKKCAELSAKINSAQKSITPRASASTLSSKLRQISSWQNEHAKKSSESATLGTKIADKKKRRNDEYVKLQKAQKAEHQNQEKQLRQMQASYAQRITEIQHSLIPKTVPITSTSSPDENYDVFVSHAWEDKASFADEFVEELQKLGVKVWYDTQKIRWGDSMRTKIDEGLKKSKFGVAILSPDYIKDGKYWTKAELDGLFQLDSINGKTLLPIWHHLTKKDVMDYSPIIASRLAMNTASMTPAEIAEELHAMLQDSVSTNQEETV